MVSKVWIISLSFLLPGLSAITVLGQSTDGILEAAERLRRVGRLEEAESLYSRILPGDPNYPQATVRLGTISYASGRPALAEKWFRENLRFNQSAEVYTLLAGAQVNQEKFEEAYGSAKKAIQLDARYAKAYTALGMIYTALDNWPDADAAYQEALRLDSKDSSTWFLLGRSYVLRNEFGKARDAFQAARRLSPESVRVYENLGLTLDLMGDPLAAEKVFLEGVKRSRSQSRPEARIHIAYGEFLFKLDRVEESRAQLEEAVRLESRNAEAHYQLAKVLFRLKQWPEAAREGQAALRSGPEDYRTHFLLSRIYTALGDDDAATRHAERAATLGDSQP